MAVPLVIIHFQIGFSLTKTIQLLGTRVPLGGIRWMLVAACANPLKNLCHLGLLATQYYWEKKEKTSSKHQHWICPSLHDCSCLDLDPQQSKLRGKYLIPQAGTKKTKSNPKCIPTYIQTLRKQQISQSSAIFTMGRHGVARGRDDGVTLQHLAESIRTVRWLPRGQKSWENGSSIFESFMEMHDDVFRFGMVYILIHTYIYIYLYSHN